MNSVYTCMWVTSLPLTIETIGNFLIQVIRGQRFSYHHVRLSENNYDFSINCFWALKFVVFNRLINALNAVYKILKKNKGIWNGSNSFWWSLEQVQNIIVGTSWKRLKTFSFFRCFVLKFEQTWMGFTALLFSLQSMKSVNNLFWTVIPQNYDLISVWTG